MIYLDVKYIVIEMSVTESPCELWKALRRASRTVEDHARRHIEGLGICQSDYGILADLFERGPLAVSAIGKRVFLTSGSMTTAIDRLEEKGFVVRKDHPEDRRARTVHLTPQGRAFIRRAEGEHERAIAGALSSLSAAEKREALRLLTKLHAADADGGEDAA